MNMRFSPFRRTKASAGEGDFRLSVMHSKEPIWTTRAFGDESVSQRQTGPHRRRPLDGIDPMRREKCDRQPVDAERGACGMGGLEVCASEAPSQSEVIAVIVEAHARARRFRRSNRDEHLEFQRLRHLEPSDHRAGAAEERVACGLDTGERPSAPAISAARAIQCSRKSATCLGGPIATNSRMRKDLQPIDFARSRRKQSPATSKASPPGGSGPRAAAIG
jgi:hypothetical protein